VAGLAQTAGSPLTAIACLRQGLENLPGRPELLAPLAELQIEHDQREEARVVIEDLRREPATRAMADYLAGRLLLKERRWTEAARVLERAGTAPEASVQLACRAWISIAECAAQLGDGDRRL